MFGFGFKQFKQSIMIPAAQIFQALKGLNTTLHKFIS